MLQRILTALGFGATALLPVLFCPECKPPHNFEEAWPLIGVFVVTAYGAYKSNTTILAPNRKIWTEDDRREILGLAPKKLPPAN